MNAPFVAPATARPLPAHEPVHTPEFIAALPALYSLTETVGDCMEPLIRDGAKLVFSSVALVRPLDVVAIWWAPGKHAVGTFQVQIKQVIVPPTAEWPIFIYRTLNPVRSYAGLAENALAVHKCLGFRGPDGCLVPVDFAARAAKLQMVRS